MGREINYTTWYNQNKELLRVISTYYPRMVENMMLKDYDSGIKLVKELDELIENFLKNYDKNKK
jgi:hypothetical protein